MCHLLMKAEPIIKELQHCNSMSHDICTMHVKDLKRKRKEKYINQLESIATTQKTVRVQQGNEMKKEM